MDFGAIINWLRELFNEYIQFWWIVNEYDKGIVLRFGKYHKTLNPGFHLKLPWADNVLEHTVVTTTMALPPQSLTTKDNKPVVVKVIVKYHISNIKPFLLKIWDAVDVISDVTQGFVRDVVVSTNLSDLNGDEVNTIITEKAKKAVAGFGVAIEKVTITNLGQIKSLRLFTEKDLTTVLQS